MKYQSIPVELSRRIDPKHVVRHTSDGTRAVVPRWVCRQMVRKQAQVLYVAVNTAGGRIDG